MAKDIERAVGELYEIIDAHTHTYPTVAQALSYLRWLQEDARVGCQHKWDTRRPERLAG